MTYVQKLAEELMLKPIAEHRQIMEDWCFKQGWHIIQRPDMVLLNDGLGNMKASQLTVVYLREVGGNRNTALARAIGQANDSREVVNID